MLGHTATAELRLPEVLAERCVHSLIEQATCRACIDACPTRAWVIDDERIGIDENRCDGCGLCAAACPQGAILDRYAPTRYWVEGVEIAFAACEHADTSGTGRLPCLHALGLKRLLELHANGIRRLILSRGECDACPRGNVSRIDAELVRANRLLEDRGLAPIHAEFLAPAPWSRARAAARARHRPPTLSRRDLFRRAAQMLAERLARSEGSATGLPAVVAPGRLLPRTHPTQIAPHAPRIDPQRCTGCDACARLCPQGAVGITPEAYRFEADACTGCGICQDVCTAGAIAIDHLESDPQVILPLRHARCRACGAPFHSPAARAHAGELCPVCTATGHHARLFQVLS